MSRHHRTAEQIAECREHLLIQRETEEIREELRLLESGKFQHTESDYIYVVYCGNQSFRDGRSNNRHVDKFAAGSIWIEVDLVSGGSFRPVHERGIGRRT